MKRLGERIKQKREMQKMQLSDLAKKAGISASALSQIENAKSFPSIITLKNIAEQLQTSVGELIGENESLTNNPVFRRDEIVLINSNKSGTEVFLLSQHDVSKQMETFLLTFKAQSDSSDLFKDYHNQVFAYVIEGEILFEIDNRSYVIQPGDSIYFNAKRNFRLENLLSDKSLLLCVATTKNA